MFICIKSIRRLEVTPIKPLSGIKKEKHFFKNSPGHKLKIQG